MARPFVGTGMLLIFLLIAVVVVLIGLAAAQLLVPRIIAVRIAERLTHGGGEAVVRIHAFPIWSLITRRGDELAIEASGLRLEENPDRERGAPLRHLDGFERVQVRIEDFRAEGLDIEWLTVERGRRGSYRMRLQGTLTPTMIAVAMDVSLRSDEGAARIVEGGGSVAGVPGGSLMATVGNAVLARL